MKNSFVFYTEWLEQIKLIAACGTKDDMASLCDGLKALVEDGEVNTLTPLAQAVFNPMKNQIARDAARYEETSQKRRESANKRWQNVTNDGKAIQPDTNVCKSIQTHTNDAEDDDVDVDDDVSPKGDVSIVCAEPLIGLPLNDGSEHPVTEADLAEYSSLYPAVDVMQQLRNMRGWLLSNPTHRKTKRGIKAFITKWLSKEQDRARSGTKNTKTMTAEEILNLPAVNPWRYTG